ncbi:MAG: PPC domain-containing protein [Pirellulales bacterium]
MSGAVCRIVTAAMLLTTGPCLVGWCLAAPPTLTRIYPAGGQRGSEVVVELSGEFDWPANVWAPGLNVTPESDKGKLRVKIPADLPTDRAWLRVYSTQGASSMLPLLIGDLEELAETEPNNTVKQAQEVKPSGVTVNGVLQENGDVDTFAVQLESGQTLVAALDANTRLGSPMDAILQLVTADGRVVAENHDAVGLDPRLVYRAPAAGRYLVRVFAYPAQPDTTFVMRGGANYVYRLTVTAGPYITHAVPMTLDRPEQSPVRVAGWNVPDGTRLPMIGLSSPEGEPTAAAREFDGAGSFQYPGSARLGFVAAPEYGGAARVWSTPGMASVVAGESDDPLSAPVAVTGCIGEKRGRWAGQVKMAAGRAVEFSVDAQQVGSLLVPGLRVWDPAGKLVAESSVDGPRQDVSLTVTPESDGEYRVELTDRFGGGGDGCFFRLVMRGVEPDYGLTVAADSWVLESGKELELEVKVARRSDPGASIGAVTISAEGLPEGVVATPVVSEATGPTAEKVMLKLSASAGTSFSGPIRLRGTGGNDGALVRYARGPVQLGATFDMFWLIVPVAAK